MNSPWHSLRAALVLTCCAMTLSPACAAPAGGLANIAKVAREYRAAHEHEIVNEFVELLRIPNVSNDADNIQRNAAAIAEMMRRRGLSPKLLQVPGAPPAVYGEWKVPNAKRTIVLYAHYDGQPVHPAGWATPPWTPTLRNGKVEEGGATVSLASLGKTIDPDLRIYARGAADDKNSVMAILSAIDALRAARRQPTANIKLFFEGEEEEGASVHMREILEQNRALLASDLWVACDGPMHSSGKVQVVYGARGDMNVDLTVYGPTRGLHSGHYGNWAPNPALRLARLLASMKDANGKVTIAGWYDDVLPLGKAERRAIAEAAVYDEPLRKELGIPVPESPYPLAEAVTRPSLNINGMASANVGEEAANVIPERATAVLDVRLVMGNEQARQFEKLRAHVQSQGYYVIDREPTVEERRSHPLIATLKLRPGGAEATRIPMDDPLAHAIAEAVRVSAASGIIELPTSGGTLPMDRVRDVLGTSTITVSTANYDNNQHAANENLRLGSLWQAIEVYAAVLAHGVAEGHAR